MNRALPQEVLDQIELEHQHFAASPQAFFETWMRGARIAGAEWFGDGTAKACSVPPPSGICGRNC